MFVIPPCSPQIVEQALPAPVCYSCESNEPEPVNPPWDQAEIRFNFMAEKSNDESVDVVGLVYTSDGVDDFGASNFPLYEPLRKFNILVIDGNKFTISIAGIPPAYASGSWSLKDMDTVIMNGEYTLSGDEINLEFPFTGEPPMVDGMKYDFWLVKDD